jgi:hypothetical protein
MENDKVRKISAPAAEVSRAERTTNVLFWVQTTHALCANE